MFVEWFKLYTYYYAAQVANTRFDLRFVEAAPHADQTGLPESVVEFVGDNISTHPVLSAQAWPELKAAGYHLQKYTIDTTPFYQIEKR